MNVRRNDFEKNCCKLYPGKYTLEFGVGGYLVVWDFLLFVWFLVVGIELRDSCMLSIHTTTKSPLTPKC